MNVDPNGNVWWNPFSWDWGSVVEDVGDFFVDNWDIILGTGLVIGAVAISVLTFGTGTVISGVIAGGVFGSAFGALGAAINGGNILQGALTGLFVGTLGGISGWAAFTGAAGMSLIMDRINGKKAGFDSLVRAGVYGFTAGLFAGGCNGMSNAIIAGSTDIALRVSAGVLGAFIFSSYNFIADAIINKFEVV